MNVKPLRTLQTALGLSGDSVDGQFSPVTRIRVKATLQDKTHHTLSRIAEAWGDSAAAAEWAPKRDARPAQIKRLAGGSGDLST